MKDQAKTKQQRIAEFDIHNEHEVDTKPDQMLKFERQQRQMVEAIYQASAALHSTLQYDQVLDHMLDQLPQIVPHDAACIMLVRGDTVRIVRWHGYSQHGAKKFISPFVLKIADIPGLSTMRKTGRPLIIPQTTKDDAWVTQSGHLWINSYVGIPISGQGQVIGFVQVDSATPGFFDEDHAERLQAFVSHAVVALKNAWLYGQARREIMARVKALKTERNFVSTVLDQAGALVIILDTEQRIIRYNQTCEKTLGYTFDEVGNQYIWDQLISSQEIESVKAVFDKLVEGHFPIEYESSWLTKDGETCLIAWSSTALKDNRGTVEYIINTGHDITERKQIEEALRRGGERYALAVLATNEGLWDWDLRTDEIYYSPRWKAILGYQEAEIQPSVEEWFSRVHPEDLAHLKLDIAGHLEGSTATFKSEYRMLDWDGNYRWMRTQGLAVRDVNGSPYRMTGSQADITRRKLDEDQLRHASLHDALTGLPNRAAFMDNLEQTLERVKKDENYLFAILFLDLDRFKAINDNLGHLVGDKLLIAVAQRLKQCIRSGDIVARLGGDEFTILLNNIHETNDAVLVADRVQQALTTPITLAGQELYTSTSIGIAIGSADYTSAEEILRDADVTMYQAKAQGRARHALYKTGIFPLTQARFLEAELREAIEREEFQVYYQPIVSVADGQMVGVEALLRWEHPQRGLIGPDQFIPLAEETGLINPIGEWVIRTACAQMKSWHAEGFLFLRLSLNVSIRQFHREGQQDFPEIFRNILAETGLAAQAVELEITESIPLIDNEFNQSIVNELKRLGVRIALDDFGISSPLGLLKQFSIDTIKIDRSFIMSTNQNIQEEAITAAIIKIAHSLNLTTVAEGVETEEQLAWLRDHQCDEMQGFLFSTPLPPQELKELLLADK